MKKLIKSNLFLQQAKIIVGEGINEALEEGIESTKELENTPSRYVQKNHLEPWILGEKEVGVQTRRTLVGTSSYLVLLSTIEPQNVNQARKINIGLRKWMNNLIK